MLLLRTAIGLQSSQALRVECELLQCIDYALTPTESQSLTLLSGKAIALRLANDGYNVCINDIAANKSEAEDVVKEIQGLGRKSFAYSADVSNLSEVQGLVQASVSELGPLNTMVANAGIAQVKSLLDLTEQDLKRMFEVNGAFAVTLFHCPLLTMPSLRRVQLLFYCSQTNDLSRNRRKTSRCSLDCSLQTLRAPISLQCIKVCCPWLDPSIRNGNGRAQDHRERIRTGYRGDCYVGLD